MREPDWKRMFQRTEDAGVKLANRVDDLLKMVYPEDVFHGCDGCEAGTCATDPGVRAIRRVRNALREWRWREDAVVHQGPAEDGES